MKKILLLFILAVFVSQVFSQHLISKTFLRSYSVLQLDSILSAKGIPPVFNLTYGIDIYKINYQTVSYDSSATTASGLMTVPKAAICREFPMASYFHGTIAQKDQAPSSLNGDEPVIGMIMASIGYITAEPDYLGLGDGPGLHPYQHAQTEASASIDMLRSVREYCDSAGVHRNGQLFLMGYSQGGHACMATHRVIQEQLAGELAVTASVPMSGAYDMSGVMVQTMLSDSPYAQPGYLPFLVLSWNPIYHIYDSIQQAFVHPYDSVLPILFDGTHGIGDINNIMPSVPKHIFTQSELDTFTYHLNSPFRLALSANDVYHWRPACPTRLYFCKADTYVPYLNAIVAIDSMRAHGVTTVDTLDVNPGLGHVACATYAIYDAKNFFDRYMHIDTCTATGVYATLEEHTTINIYPSPARGEIVIDSRLTETQAEAAIYDLNGQKIRDLTLHNGANPVSLNALCAGVYILEIHDGGQLRMLRMILE
jgi:pimeloyl-ACP methyl ester carboxylesterase